MNTGLRLNISFSRLEATNVYEVIKHIVVGFNVDVWEFFLTLIVMHT